MKTCRLCLGKTAEMYIFKEDLSLFITILSYCKLKICKDDGLPEFVCLSCVQRLKEVVEFINQCEESDRILRSNLDVDLIKSEIKLEDGTDIKAEHMETNMNLSDFNFDTIDIENSAFDDLPDCQENRQDNSDEIEIKKPKRRVKKTKNAEKISKSGQLCTVCGKHYANNYNFERHMQTHGDKTFFCDECPKTFYVKDKLRAHKLTHTLLKKHPCEFCDKYFKTNYDSKIHMKYVHKNIKPTPCNLCDKVFYRPYYLKVHMLTHTAERKYECEICHKSFCIKHLLTAHTRVHTGERRYSCHYCDSKFTILQSLKEHERLHTGEKPYKCPICLKGFAQKGNMKSHFKYNHKGKDFKKAVIAYQLTSTQNT